MLTDEDIADRIALNRLYEKRLTNRATKEGFFYFDNYDIMVAQGRETFLVIPHDMAIGFPLFMDGESDFFKLEKTISLLRQEAAHPVGTLWDVGANIGPICIPALTRNVVERAVAFEPEQVLFKLLRANAVLNEVDDRLRCINVGLGPSEGVAELTLPDGNTGDYRISGKRFDDDAMGEGTRRVEQVKLKPMDAFIDLFAPDSTLIFMDIQGYEGAALRGAREILTRAPPLVVEFWPYAMRRLETYRELRECLCAGFYTKFADLSQESPGFSSLSGDALDALYQYLGEGPQSSTDLLFV